MDQDLSPQWHLRLWNDEEWNNEQENVRGDVPGCCEDEVMVVGRTLCCVLVNDLFASRETCSTYRLRQVPPSTV